MDPFSRISIDHWEVIRVEQRGAAPKDWLLEEGRNRSDVDAQWLFKPALVHSNGMRQAGDWTEVVASLVAATLEVPSAEARLATRRNEEGVLIRNARPEGFELHSGTLALLDRGILLRREDHDGPATRGHTLDNVFRALDGMSAPPAAATWQECSASDVFTGYLVLDALVANGDRHEENWSILRGHTPGADALAPSYDMENSLGFQLTDDHRERHLAEDNCRKYAENGLAKRLDGDRRNTLVHVAARAYGSSTAAGRRRIDNMIGAISDVNFDAVVPETPAVSEVTRRFAISLLTNNARRIADAIDRRR